MKHARKQISFHRIMQNIIDSILPGNYWLTKSMEFSKRESSGSLWYLKKWFIYYHFVFLKEHLYDNDYRQITDIFQRYIDSIPLSNKQEATDFFFDIDIRGNSFLKLNEFLYTQSNFTNQDEEKNFKINGKRFYFMYLMGLGGQSGYKAKMKELIENGNTYENVVTEITKIILSEGETQAKVTEQLIDFPATIRNERQIHFYYGFFHGKESKDLSGFYNLTTVGKAILKANFYELLIIWEHQKLKMISQSPVADIQNIENENGLDLTKFATLNNPYFTLLKIIKEKSEISFEQYQFIISKISNQTNIDIIVRDVLGNAGNEKLFSQKAEGFNRKGETVNEDFTKELKKFILGICEMPKDQNSNPFYSLSWLTNQKITINNQNKFNFLVDAYSIISKYLNEENTELYQSFEQSLKQTYIDLSNGNNNPLTDELKYEWYKYIINFDANVLIQLIYTCLSLEKNIFNFSIDNAIFKNEFEKYQNLCTLLGLKKKDFVKILSDVQTELQTGNYFKFDIEENQKYKFIDPRKLQSDVSIEKLLEISQKSVEENNLYISANRLRNPNLIHALRSYYYNNHIDKNTKHIDCDCCGNTTFITYNNFPYLEFHHIIPFSTEFGPDHYLNLVGICPNCHRRMHFAKPEAREELYQLTSENNNFKIPLTERVNKLFQQKLLEPIHLDFLKKEKIITADHYEQLMSNRVTV